MERKKKIMCAHLKYKSLSRALISSVGSSAHIFLYVIQWILRYRVFLYTEEEGISKKGKFGSESTRPVGFEFTKYRNQTPDRART